jgi:Family of unknown function (DUF6221)
MAESLSEVDRILAWVRAQLDTDEQLARAAIIPAHDGPNAYKPHPELAAWRYSPGGEVEYVSTPEMQRHEYADTYFVTCDGEGLLPAVDERVGPHIARHDPASVLDLVAAHRAILDLLDYIPGDGANFTLAEQERAEDVIRHLAAAYSGRDGYDENWRPA